MIKILTADYFNTIFTNIHTATTTIDILTYVFTFNIHKRSDRANLIHHSLSQFQLKTGTVRLILDKPRIHKPNYHSNMFSTRRFKDSSIAVRHLNSGDTQHAKLFTFDNRVAILGSHNPTPTSLRNKHELSVLLDDSTSLLYLQAYFQQIWDFSIEA